jgi:hypothetical protein
MSYVNLFIDEYLFFFFLKKKKGKKGKKKKREERGKEKQLFLYVHQKIPNYRISMGKSGIT